VLVLPDGSEITLAITLGDPDADNGAGRFVREYDASAHGLISIVGMADVPEFPIVWMVSGSSLLLAATTGDRAISEELQAIIELHLGLFFIQTAPVAPHLARFRIAPNALANDSRTVH